MQVSRTQLLTIYNSLCSGSENTDAKSVAVNTRRQVFILKLGHRASISEIYTTIQTSDSCDVSS